MPRSPITRGFAGPWWLYKDLIFYAFGTSWFRGSIVDFSDCFNMDVAWLKQFPLQRIRDTLYCDIRNGLLECRDLDGRPVEFTRKEFERSCMKLWPNRSRYAAQVLVTPLGGLVWQTQFGHDWDDYVEMRGEEGKFHDLKPFAKNHHQTTTCRLSKLQKLLADGLFMAEFRLLKQQPKFQAAYCAEWLDVWESSGAEWIYFFSVPGKTTFEVFPETFRLAIVTNWQPSYCLPPFPKAWRFLTMARHGSFSFSFRNFRPGAIREWDWDEWPFFPDEIVISS